MVPNDEAIVPALGMLGLRPADSFDGHPIGSG